MRIGDVGSISPAGELAAFAVAVAVVVSISAFIVPDGERNGTGIGPDEIILVSEWAGLDPDDDGMIELKDNGIAVSTSIPFPITGKIGIELFANGSGSILLFENREIRDMDFEHRIISEIHEMMVLVQKGSHCLPGLLSIYKWEAGQ